MKNPPLFREGTRWLGTFVAELWVWTMASASLPAQDTFTLAAEGPRTLCAEPGTTMVVDYLVVLTHAGRGEGARAWSFGLELAQPNSVPGRPRLTLRAISLEGTDAGAHNGVEVTALTVLPGKRAIASVALVDGDDGTSLPSNARAIVARLGVEVSFPELALVPVGTRGGWEYTGAFHFLPELDTHSVHVLTSALQGSERPLG